jgi:carbon storage regulator
MLMISRRVGERIVIGNDIEVTVTEIHRRTVRLAISTGPAHKVLRGEVYESVQRTNRLAAQSVIDEETLASGSHLAANTATDPAAEPRAPAPKESVAEATGQNVEEAARRC